MDDQALVPDNDELGLFTEDIAQQEDHVQKAELELDQRVIALQQDPGWQQFESRLDYYIDFFRSGSFLGDAIENMTKEQIGEKYIVASTVAGICDELKGLMTGAVQSVVNENAKRKAAEQQQSAQ